MMTIYSSQAFLVRFAMSLCWGPLGVLELGARADTPPCMEKALYRSAIAQMFYTHPVISRVAAISQENPSFITFIANTHKCLINFPLPCSIAGEKKHFWQCSKRQRPPRHAATRHTFCWRFPSASGLVSCVLGRLAHSSTPPEGKK